LTIREYEARHKDLEDKVDGIDRRLWIVLVAVLGILGTLLTGVKI